MTQKKEIYVQTEEEKVRHFVFDIYDGLIDLPELAPDNQISKPKVIFYEYESPE